MPTVRAGDLDVHYTERGSGPPIVLLHGGLATAAISWSDDNVGRLAANHRVLMPDTRGHGKTTNPAGTLSYPQLADDVVAFGQALGLERPVVIGYSDGGQAGIELGLRHPGFARALVLGGVVTGPSPAYFDMLAGMGITKAGEVDAEAMRRAFGDELFEAMIVTPHASWKTLLDQIGRLWTTVPAYDAARLGTISTPCLVICGDRDRPVLDAALPLARALPTAELAVVPCSEHGAAMKPLFWTNVLDFLSRH